MLERKGKILDQICISVICSRAFYVLMLEVLEG